eukprot:jgi/Pico_ML_1/52413/g3120.t1
MTLLLALEDNLADVYEAVVELELAGFFDMKPGSFAVLSGPSFLMTPSSFSKEACEP